MWARQHISLINSLSPTLLFHWDYSVGCITSEILLSFPNWNTFLELWAYYAYIHTMKLSTRGYMEISSLQHFYWVSIKCIFIFLFDHKNYFKCQNSYYRRWVKIRPRKQVRVETLATNILKDYIHLHVGLTLARELSVAHRSAEGSVIWQYIFSLNVLAGRSTTCRWATSPATLLQYHNQLK